ncbi:MAG: hypothetical protein U9O82_14190, partial [Thermodesulfobacteriota bacterium]|nr:hypothetical protein [Thermodesulfobacteriota bacterium]
MSLIYESLKKTGTSDEPDIIEIKQQKTGCDQSGSHRFIIVRASLASAHIWRTCKRLHTEESANPDKLEIFKGPGLCSV